jgi:hypothetical protein
MALWKSEHNTGLAPHPLVLPALSIVPFTLARFVTL